MSAVVVAVVGLGYVGLPLAVEFGKKYRTINMGTWLKKPILLDINGENAELKSVEDFLVE